MISEIFRLNSLMPHGFSNSETGFIELVYSNYLYDYGLKIYGYLFINLIDDKLNELIGKSGNQRTINIRYPLKGNINNMSDEEKCKLQIDCINEALIRLANYEGKLDIKKLSAVKEEILKNGFTFYYTCNEFVYKKNKNLIAKIILHPQMTKFEYYVSITANGVEKCRIKIFCGHTNLFCYHGFFTKGKWINENEFILNGNRKEVEIVIKVDSNEVFYNNLTKYDSPPFFQICRSDISDEERAKANANWEHSLPPSSIVHLDNREN